MALLLLLLLHGAFSCGVKGWTTVTFKINSLDTTLIFIGRIQNAIL
jgi:hypothetical protein